MRFLPRSFDCDSDLPVFGILIWSRLDTIHGPGRFGGQRGKECARLMVIHREYRMAGRTPRTRRALMPHHIGQPRVL